MFYTNRRSRNRFGLNQQEILWLFKPEIKEMDEFDAAAEELGFDFRKSKKWQEFQDVKKILLLNALYFFKS